MLAVLECSLCSQQIKRDFRAIKGILLAIITPAHWWLLVCCQCIGPRWTTAINLSAACVWGSECTLTLAVAFKPFALFRSPIFVSRWFCLRYARHQENSSSFAYWRMVRSYRYLCCHTKSLFSCQQRSHGQWTSSATEPKLTYANISVVGVCVCVQGVNSNYHLTRY